MQGVAAETTNNRVGRPELKAPAAKIESALENGDRYCVFAFGALIGLNGSLKFGHSRAPAIRSRDKVLIWGERTVCDLGKYGGALMPNNPLKGSGDEN